MGDYFTFTRLVDSIDTVLSGAGATFEIVIFSFLIALAAGILLAVIRIRTIPVAAQIVAVFNSFMRRTPMIVQIYLVYYGLPFFMMFAVSILIDILYHKDTLIAVSAFLSLIISWAILKQISKKINKSPVKILE